MDTRWMGSTRKSCEHNPSLWQRVGLPPLVGFLTLVGGVGMFPPFDLAELAYLFLIPVLVWSLLRPSWKTFAITTLLTSWGIWLVILIWLRHVNYPAGWFAVLALSLVVGLFYWIWMLAARAMLPSAVASGMASRLAVMITLGALWVVLEWVRTWLFTGFPWLPLAASQWQRPALLQIAAWTGFYGVSFTLVVANFGLLFYGRHLVEQVRGRRSGQWADGDSSEIEPSRQAGAGFAWMLGGRFRVSLCLEFYAALGIFLVSLMAYFQSMIQAGAGREPMFRASAVQPWIPAILKWEGDFARETLRTMQWQSEVAAMTQPDLILWPEAATPYPILDGYEDNMRRWMEALVNQINIPILSGNLALIDGQLYNGVFLVNPGQGLAPEHYLKQRPVPFGEYVPYRSILFFVEKVVPLAEDIVPGPGPTLIPVVVGDREWPVGVLICNEDIYSRLGRGVARAGATWILVVTNNAWYGEEAGAYQHAANSVLRAVETRLPVVRCGNHGWSGWIDEFGQIREVLTDGSGSIYFQGSGPLTVSRATALGGQQSFYVRYGDWWVAVCGAVVLWAGIRARKQRKDRWD